MILLLLLLFPIVYSTDTYNFCLVCKCVTTAQISTMDCKNHNFYRAPADTWPANFTSSTTIKVTFSGNNITTLEPLASTDALLEIVLSKCNMKYLKPGLFTKTRNIKFVDLSYNLLTTEEVSAEKFKGPYNNSAFEPLPLEYLNLAHNQIHSLGKNLFEHLPNLKVLNLEGNDFKVLDLHTQLALTSIPHLENLNLADNELTELVKHAIINHPKLTKLNLAKNKLDFVPETLEYVGKTLQVLILDDNPIRELISESFLGLQVIKELSLNNLSELKYINANTFVPMLQLKNLSLSNNLLLKDIDREAFSVDQRLDEFYLNNNILYRIDYKLLNWSTLHIFEFKENPLDCSCDLYNITMALSEDVTRNQDGPYCTDPRNDRPVPVFYLKKDICSVKSKYQVQRDFIQYHFSLMRIALITLSVILMLVAFIAAVLGFIRYRKYVRNKNYPYASQVLYNPLSMNSRI